ncbi:MAG: outer membrane beta-barrel protein [Marinobacter sp.]|nr:outer membrane beta-barrel protein [Marinobacter sp.]
MSRTFKYSLLAASIFAAPLAQAYEAGSLLIRAGVVNVYPDSGSSDDLRLNGVTQPGLKVSVDDNYQLGLSATYMITDHIAVGLLAATPFKHNIKGADALDGAGKLAETKHLPPTLSVLYYPLANERMIQPYVGVGINYTVFFEEKTTDTLTGFLQGIDPNIASTNISLDSSVGVAVEAGVDFRLSDTFAINAGIWWADIGTTATIKALDADGTRLHTAKVDVDIDPMVYMVGFSFKF